MHPNLNVVEKIDLFNELNYLLRYSDCCTRATWTVSLSSLTEMSLPLTEAELWLIPNASRSMKAM